MIKNTRVHEKTVQKVAKGEVKKPRHTRRKTAQDRIRMTQKGTGRVVIVKVDPRVMKEARRLAKGDMSRIQIKDETTVIVKNHH